MIKRTGETFQDNAGGWWIILPAAQPGHGEWTGPFPTPAAAVAACNSFCAPVECSDNPIPPEAIAWLKGFFELPESARRWVMRELQDEVDLGGIDPAVGMDYLLQLEGREMPSDQLEAEMEADACYQQEEGYTFEEIAAWGAR